MRTVALGSYTGSLEMLSGRFLQRSEDADVGTRLAQQYRKEVGLIASPETDAIEAYLQKIVERLTAALPSKNYYKVVYDSNPGFKSAFVLPGNYIVVGGGILAIAEKEDEIAHVIAHEIEHSELGQVEARTSRIERQQHVLGENLKVSDYYPGYTKSQELSCDRDGAKLAQRAGFSPQAGCSLC